MIRRISLVILFLASVRGGFAMDVDVKDFGAAGDGVTDDTAAFQQALDAAGKTGGGVVRVPSAEYCIRGTLVIPVAVTLQGTFHAPPTNNRDGLSRLPGSTLQAYAGRGDPEGKPFITLKGSMAAVAGLIIYYPEWKQSDVPPVPYPPCIFAGRTDNVSVQDCLLLNPYEGMRFDHTGRMLVRNVYGYPIRRGLYIDQCYDIGRVENCHFWPFGVRYDPNDPYCRWINSEGVAFEFARTDWQYVLNTFCFGYGVGYLFSESESGSCNGNFQGIGADSCRRSVLVEQTQAGGILISNGEFVGRWANSDSIGVEIGEKVHGQVTLTNCSFWGPLAQCILQQGKASHLVATACNFVHWDVGGAGLAAVESRAGKVILQGNSFKEGKLPVRIGPDVRSALLTANQAPSGFFLENEAGDRTRLFANEENPVKWTDAARAHYRIDIGAMGDGIYLRRWNNAEDTDEWGRAGDTKRWSTGNSSLLLPVVPGKDYVLTLDARIPDYALEEEAGVYLDDRRLAPLPGVGIHRIEVPIPASDRDRIRIDLRCRGWVPAQEIEGNRDNRTLGISVRGVEMRARDAGEAVFLANDGTWSEKELQPAE